MGKKEFYTEQICCSFLPFWEKAVDKQRGGIYTCFNNTGDTLLSTDKYVWSQGRYLWLWARLISLIRRGLLPLNETAYMDDLRLGVSFIMEHAFLPNGNCVFLLDENGAHKLSSEVYDSSIYVDCFVCLGFSEYASLTGDLKVLDKASDIYKNITRRLEGEYHTMPYPIPKGGRIFGIPMFAMHVGQELSNAMRKLHHPQEVEVRRKACAFFDILMSDFLTGPYNKEMILPSDSGTLLASHLTPGHTLECAWFMMHLMRDTGDFSALSKIEAASRYALEKGWDAQYGGILRFIHRDGGKPQGSLLNDPYEELIIKTWDYKLWWPHSEALYLTLLMERYGKDSAYWRDAHNKIEDYSFRTFPNSNAQIGEWIQIRLRNGQPSDQVVALPVKDPYHILRNFFLMIEALDA